MSVYKLKHIMLTIYSQLCHNVLTVIQYYNHKEKQKTSRKDLKKVGIWTSATEVSTGYHKSRRYNQLTIRY